MTLSRAHTDLVEDPSPRLLSAATRSQTSAVSGSRPSWSNDRVDADRMLVLHDVKVGIDHDQELLQRERQQQDPLSTESYPVRQTHTPPPLPPTFEGLHAHNPPQTSNTSSGGLAGLSNDRIQFLSALADKKEGHTYGDVEIEGYGTLLQGNTYSDPLGRLVMPKNNYMGKVVIKKGASGYVQRGDMHIDGLPVVIQFHEKGQKEYYHLQEHQEVRKLQHQLAMAELAIRYGTTVQQLELRMQQQIGTHPQQNVELGRSSRSSSVDSSKH